MEVVGVEASGLADLVEVCSPIDHMPLEIPLAVLLLRKPIYRYDT